MTNWMHGFPAVGKITLNACLLASLTRKAVFAIETV